MDPFESAKQQIKDRVDLVDLIQSETPATRRGRTFVALCPFHKERTPSFTIYPETQHYKCYGCGVAGDVFSFVMEREGVSFREAMEVLAERAGVSLDGVFGGGRGRESKRRVVHDTLEQVRDWFEECLWDDRIGAPARSYLRDRGLLDGAEEFGIGYHPDESGRLAALARQKQLSQDVLGAASLLGRDGAEPMRGRVMFPITDDRGKLVGFGGRVLPDPSIPSGEDRRPKYRNSPESPFFNKRRLLYGLRQVKRSGDRRVVVVEGYTDVIALHLAGFTGAVATLGTALTAEHARLLERYATDGVVLLFDGDSAGRRAADRAFRELVHTPLPVRIALLPEGVDPADLASIDPQLDDEQRDLGRSRLEALIRDADDALTVWFRILRRALDLTSDVHVQRVAGECGRILAGVENLARRQSLRQSMAMHLGLSPEALEIPVQAPRRRSEDDTEERRPMREARPEPVRNKVEEADLDLLACVLRDSGLRAEAQALPGEHAEWLTTILGWVAVEVESGHGTYESLVARLFARSAEDEALRSSLAAGIDRASRIRDPRSVFTMLERGRNRIHVQQEIRRLKSQVQQALADGDTGRADQLTRRYMDLLRRGRSGEAGAS